MPERCVADCRPALTHWATNAIRITTYPATTPGPWKDPSRVTEAKNCGIPNARTTTPIICTIVRIR